jgi:hypothetical protein
MKVIKDLNSRRHLRRLRYKFHSTTRQQRRQCRVTGVYFFALNLFFRCEKSLNVKICNNFFVKVKPILSKFHTRKVKTSLERKQNFVCHAPSPPPLTEISASPAVSVLKVEMKILFRTNLVALLFSGSGSRNKTTYSEFRNL